MDSFTATINHERFLQTTDEMVHLWFETNRIMNILTKSEPKPMNPVTLTSDQSVSPVNLMEPKNQRIFFLLVFNYILFVFIVFIIFSMYCHCVV